MDNVKAIVDFSGYVAPELGPAAQVIHDAMVAAATTFDKPPTAMSDFQLAIDDERAKLTAKSSGAYADTLAFNNSRAALEDILNGLGNYANTLAKGDINIVSLSGFPYYNTTRTPDYSAPAAPEKVVARQGDVSGTAVVRYRPARRPSMNEVQTCVGDPGVEANWKSVGFFTNGTATISSIVPGTTVWIRVRTIGLLNVMGNWSDPVKIMVV